MFNDYPDVVNCNQLKEMLGISRPMVYELLKNNEIAHKKIGKKYIIPKLAVQNYLIGN